MADSALQQLMRAMQAKQAQGKRQQGSHAFSSSQTDPGWQEYMDTNERLNPKLGLETPLLDPLDPLNIPKKLPMAALKAYGKLAAEAVHRGVQSGSPLAMAVAPMHAVKERGGNWMHSDGLEYLRDLVGETDPQRLANIRAVQGANTGLNQEHLGKWVNGPLTNYIKRDLGTANDPLLKLADEGISPVNLGTLLDPPRWMKQNARANREAGGYPLQGLNPEGGYKGGWETMTDAMVQPYTSGEMRANLGPYYKEHIDRADPWMAKLPDEAKVYGFSGDEAPYHLGFQDIVESLRQGMDPASTLPPGLRLKPEDLQQMGMEKAVRYMDDVKKFQKVQEEREAVKRAEAIGKQGKLVKEYPTGHRIVELNKPEALDEQMTASIRQNKDGTYSPLDANGNVVKRIEMFGGNPTDVVERTPEDAYLGGMLANEGNAMQHCVGGYCADVSSGDTKIYSIRDTKGEPHVTIEAMPSRNFTQAEYDESLAHARDMGYPTDEASIYKQYGMTPPGKPAPAQINQIFGKQNTAPKDEYLPAIQDFIRSGGHEINDPTVLKNAGLRDISDFTHTTQELAKQKYPDQKYFTDDELSTLIDHSFDDTNSYGYKDGGLIQDDDFAMPGHF